MKYFTAKLWREINHENSDIRTNAEKQWQENSKEYQEYFRKIKCYFPKGVLDALEQTQSFHDYVINEISVARCGKNKYNLILRIANGKVLKKIILSGVKTVNINISSFSQGVLGRLEWGYCEFDLMPSKTIQLSILCNVQNEMHFEFEGITVKDDGYFQKRRSTGTVLREP